MSDAPSATLPFRVSLEEGLTLGYLYLLLLGIVSDSIYYAFFGVAILSWSDVLDVLLSPLTYLEKELVFSLLAVVTPVAGVLFVRWQRRRHARRSADDPAYRERLGAEGIANTAKRLAIVQWLMPAFVLLSAYTGYAIGAGHRLSERMRAGALTADHRVTFTDGERADVRVIGNNSGYLFYVRQDSTRVSIAPIKETVRAIEPL